MFLGLSTVSAHATQGSALPKLPHMAAAGGGVCSVPVTRTSRAGGGHPHPQRSAC